DNTGDQDTGADLGDDLVDDTGATTTTDQYEEARRQLIEAGWPGVDNFTEEDLDRLIANGVITF
ncbi:MAG: hypothetical protein GWO44_15295, partial [Thermoplasmata archaeon]|nr:hypothetical protein [Thermoplasmata archaeon]NIY04572.1 hypothetical protein [Thermoplasmata archaeon]